MARRSTLPWVLLVLVLMAGVGGLLVEKQQLNAAEARAAAARHDEEKARAELADVSAAESTLALRVDALQNQLTHATVKLAARSEVVKAPKPAKQKARRKHGKKRHR